MSERLASRIEGLAGPNGDFDVEIFKFRNPEYNSEEWRPYGGGLRHVCDSSDMRTRPTPQIPRFTASLDAATSLVPEGLMFTVSLHEDGKGAASIFRRNSEGERETCCKLCTGATPAIALCAAAILASI